MKDELKSFYAAVLLSLGVVFLSNFLFSDKKENIEEPQPVVETAVAETPKTLTENNEALPQENLPTEEILISSQRVDIDNSSLKGSIRANGGRIDNLWLKKYKQTLDVDSADVELFAPTKSSNPYYAEFGWLASDKNLKLPNSDTLWTIKGDKLTP